MFNSTKGINGAQCFLNTMTGTIAIAAANSIRVQGLSDLGTDVANNQTDDDFMTVMKKNLRIYQFKSASPFMVIPFIALLKHGETITATDNATGYINVAVGAACGTEHRQIVFGPTATAKLVLDGGNQYTTTLGVDFTSFWNAYAIYLRKKILASEDATRMELFTGLCVAGSASQTIAYTAENGPYPLKRI